MKVTIIKPDGCVGVNGIFYPTDLSDLPENLRVVQWNGSKGHEEWTDKSNTELNEIGKYQKYVSKWRQVDTEVKELEKNPLARMSKEEIEDLYIRKIKVNKIKAREGGVQVTIPDGTTKWFQSDTDSKIVYLTIIQLNSSVSWRTLEGTPLRLTPEIATVVLEVILKNEEALEAIEYNHKDKLKKATKVGLYDTSTGWPSGYKE